MNKEMLLAILAEAHGDKHRFELLTGFVFINCSHSFNAAYLKTGLPGASQLARMAYEAVDHAAFRFPHVRSSTAFSTFDKQLLLYAMFMVEAVGDYA